MRGLDYRALTQEISGEVETAISEVTASLEITIALFDNSIFAGGPPVVESNIGSQWRRTDFYAAREVRCHAFQHAEMHNAVSVAVVPVLLSGDRYQKEGRYGTNCVAISIEAVVTIAVGRGP